MLATCSPVSSTTPTALQTPAVVLLRAFRAALSVLLLLATTLPLPAAEPAAYVDVEAPPEKYLSAYHLFLDAAQQIPNDGVVPYDLNTPHFADYAALHRFLWLPDGTQCEYGPHGEIEFPQGAVLVISMGYPRDLRDPNSPQHIVETRLWMHRSTGWGGAQYAWNDDTTEATLSLAGEKIDVSWIHTDGQPHEHTFRIPNRIQCKQCHALENVLRPLGPIHAKYVNKDYHYATGLQNQLKRWVEVGYLDRIPAEPDELPRMVVWNDPSTGDVESRARAYLDMNCSSCHQKGGIGFTSGLDLRYEQQEPIKFGVYKAPVAAGRGAGNGRFVIEPGDPDRSILLYRLQSTDPGVRMPVVGRSIQHKEGVALIRQWIVEMDYPQLTERQQQVDRRASLQGFGRDYTKN